MMTKVCNLQEIVSAIPPTEDNPRKFTIVPNFPLWVDLSKAVVARTFNGQLLKNPKVKDDGKELPFNERKALPSKDNDNKKENESWN